jgi:hypothetical protein
MSAGPPADQILTHRVNPSTSRAGGLALGHVHPLALQPSLRAGKLRDQIKNRLAAQDQLDVGIQNRDLDHACDRIAAHRQLAGFEVVEFLCFTRSHGADLYAAAGNRDTRI